MERIVLRHLTGSKANQVEEFPLNHVKEIVLGRDPSATVKYDPDRDDLVGRQHARIVQDAADPAQFTITDLNSRNGTFVNKQRIVGSSRVAPGDVVQLGPGGPEVQFDVEPRPPQSGLRPTRGVAFDSMSPTISGTATAVPPTRSINLDAPSVATAPSSSGGGVGKLTVERMISQNIAVTKRSEGRKYMLIGGAALAAVLVLFAGVAAYLVYRNRQAESQLGQVQKGVTDAAANAPMNSAGVAKASRNTVVKVDVAWKLISPRGGLVYHQYGCPGGPCYIKLPDGIEPLLTYDEQRFGAKSKPIGGQFTASGVVVSNDGFILTSHHVAAAWETSYDFPEEAYEGTLVERDSFGELKIIRPINIRQERNFNWIPAETKQEIITQQLIKGKSPKVIKEAEFSGRNDRLDVFFPGAIERNTARQVKASERYDVAMIRVDLPSGLPKAELHDNLDTVKQGDGVIVFGYQLTSLPVYYFKQESQSQQKEIPEPTITNATIGKLVRVQEASATRQGSFSKIGDAFQLSVNTRDTGYDGAPVFDDRGRVIGIFNVDKTLLEEPITVAVPIRYAIELMSVTR